MGAHSVIDSALPEYRSNHLRNSDVELRTALQAQTVDRSRGTAKLSLLLRRQRVRTALERREGGSSVHARFTFPWRHSYTASVRPPCNLPRLLVAACRYSRS